MGRATGEIPARRQHIGHFYPRPPWGGRHWTVAKPELPGQISIHALRGEGDPHYLTVNLPPANFYPRPPWGGRLHGHLQGRQIALFLSTPSVGRATIREMFIAETHSYFYPRPPWGGRLCPVVHDSPNVKNFYPRPPWGGRLPGDLVLGIIIGISIHALRGEGDRPETRTAFGRTHFYPRPPWGGRPASRSKTGGLL